MSGSNTALLLLLSATICLVTAASECFDVNIKYSSGAVLVKVIFKRKTYSELTLA